MKMNDTIRAMFDGCEIMDKGKIIDRLMSKYNLKESSAKSYYYTWKREFMNGANCTPIKDDIPEADLKEEKKLGKSFIDAIIDAPWPETEKEAKEYTGVIIAKDPIEPENDLIIECDSDEDMRVYADKCKEQGYEVQKVVEETPTVTVQEIVEMALSKDKPKVKFMPIVVSGGYFTYRMSYTGLVIEDGLIDVITKDCIEEQAAALELWEKYYTEVR